MELKFKQNNDDQNHRRPLENPHPLFLPSSLYHPELFALSLLYGESFEQRGKKQD